LPIFRADFHVHTVLSPCADTEMIPPLIVQESIQNGIDIIAITDHNSCANVAAVQKAALGTNLHVLPGIELQTSEEVHVLCIFDELDQVQELQKHIDAALPDQENNIDFFGEQFIVDETGDFIRREERLLLVSSELSLHSAWQITTTLGGLLIPAHVNRKAFGLFQVLGFVPPETPIEILEISTSITLEEARSRHPSLWNFALTQNGDAHFLEDIKGLNRLTIQHQEIAEIRLAFLNSENRLAEIIRNT
jgi:PHP family Zn ribbon phosphoesterase